MAKFQPWLKMWVEWVDDPKMLSLSLAEQGAWWRLCTLAKKCAADGFLVKGRGVPLSLDQITDAIRIKTKADRMVFDRMIQKMIDQGSLHWDHNVLVVTHFADRQAKRASETPEAVAERVRRYRERKAVTENPLQEKKEPASTPHPSQDIDIDIDIDEDTECNVVTSLHRNGGIVTPEAVLAEISRLHEENISIITPLLSEKFKDFAENYRGPLVWIKDAFAEAVTKNVRKWAYVEKILDNWQSEGRKTHGEREKQEGTRAPAHRKDPLAVTKQRGWKVKRSGPGEPGD